MSSRLLRLVRPLAFLLGIALSLLAIYSYRLRPSWSFVIRRWFCRMKPCGRLNSFGAPWLGWGCR